MFNSSSPTNPSTINSSDDNQTDLFAPEPSELMGNPEMVKHLCTAFSEDLIGMMLVRYYQYISHCITLGVDMLDWHYKEENNLFHYTISNEGFNQTLRPVARMYRRKQQELSHPYSWLWSHIQTPSDDQSIDPSTSSDSNNNPPPSDIQSIPILPEPSNASSSPSSYVTAPNKQPDPVTQTTVPSPKLKSPSHQLHIPNHLGPLVEPSNKWLMRESGHRTTTQSTWTTWQWSRIVMT